MGIGELHPEPVSLEEKTKLSVGSDVSIFLAQNEAPVFTAPDPGSQSASTNGNVPVDTSEGIIQHGKALALVYVSTTDP